MSSSISGLILGYHGCDKEIAEKVLSGNDHLAFSKNSYDWLGHGIYFWENSYSRAFEYALSIKNNPQQIRNQIKTPAVIGAVIDLENCLNLLDSKYIKIVKEGHKVLNNTLRKAITKIPVNKKQIDGVPMLRHLDCAVIESVHSYRKERNDKQEPEFDSVRAMFPEGKELYLGAGFNTKSHIQLCIRNHNCIRAYFRPPESI